MSKYELSTIINGKSVTLHWEFTTEAAAEEFFHMLNAQMDEEGRIHIRLGGLEHIGTVSSQ